MVKGVNQCSVLRITQSGRSPSRFSYSHQPHQVRCRNNKVQQEFNELWNKITSTVTDKPPLPEVDFSREMLLVASMGQQKTA